MKHDFLANMKVVLNRVILLFKYKFYDGNTLSFEKPIKMTEEYFM